MSHPGLILADKFKLVSRIGQGGMGSVWRAEHLQLGSSVAIKLIDPDLASSEDALARFRREAKAAAALQSPHVVQIFDYGVDQGIPFIAMELLQGESLAARLERVGRLSPRELATLMTQAARAVARAHDAGIVHRDLKPDNIFLVRNDDEDIAKVLDFGIAKAIGPRFAESMAAPNNTRTGVMVGTPFYMSPEQAQGTKAVDFRSDLWALGVIAYECLVGRRPFESDALGDLVLRICTMPIPVPSAAGPVPRGFDEWFARACHREPAGRFANAREMTEALRLVLLGSAGEPILVSSPPPPLSGGAAGAMFANTESALSRSAIGPGLSSVRKRVGIGAAVVLAIAAISAAGLIASRKVSNTTPTTSADPLSATAAASLPPLAASTASAVAIAPPPPADSVDAPAVASAKGDARTVPAPPPKPAKSVAPPAANPPPRNYGF